MTRREFSTLATGFLATTNLRAQSPSPIQADLGGFAGDRLRLNVTQSLATFDIHHYIGMVERRLYRGSLPLGEQPGQWLEAAILASEWSGNVLLRQRTTGMLERLLAAQDSDGYLGISAREVRFRANEPCELTSTLHALLTAWDVWQNGPALTAASRLADLLVAGLEPRTAAILVDPLLRAYQAIGGESLLAWCRTAARHIGPASSDPERLGLLRLAEIGGGRPAFRPSSPDTANVGTCALAASILFNQKLLDLTRNPACADAIEHLLWNHLFAAQTVDGDGFRCHTPEQGWKPEGYYTGPDCCSSTGPLILARVPSLFYSVSPGAIHVNQYAPSNTRIDIDGASVAIRQETTYPSDGRVAIELTPSRPAGFALRLRLPAWCPAPSVHLNGRSSGGTINRTWNRGDRVELNFPMETRWVKNASGQVALTRGPLLYVLDGRWNGVPAVARLKTVSKTARQRPAPDATTLGPAFEVRLLIEDGSTRTALMTPFANLGDWYRSSAEKSAWLERVSADAAAGPDVVANDPSGRVLPYRVWLPRA